MHNSFIFKQYVCYTTLLNMFAAHHKEDQLYHHSLWYRHPLLTAFQYAGVRLFTEVDDTRVCGDKICPPEDEQRAARNMLRIVV